MPEADHRPPALGRELAQLALDVLGQTDDVPRSTTVVEGLVPPEGFEDLDQVGLASAVEPADPGRGLGASSQVREEGIEDAVEASLVLPLADEGGEFVGQGGRVADLAHPIVLQGMPGGVAIEDVAIQDLPRVRPLNLHR